MVPTKVGEKTASLANGSGKLDIHILKLIPISHPVQKSIENGSKTLI
jgi:hypothetical protein